MWTLKLAFAAFYVFSAIYAETTDPEEKAQATMAQMFNDLSPECLAEVENNKESPDNLSNECREEIQKALSAAMGDQLKEKMGDTKGSSDKTKKTKKKKNRSPSKKKKAGDSAITVIVSFLTASFFGLLGACWYINRQLGDAGLYKNDSTKKLSKKKQEKKRRSANSSN